MKTCLAIPFVVALALWAGVADTQALGTDIFTGQTSGRICRLTPTGVATTLGSFGYFINMLTMDTDNKTIVAMDSLNSSSSQRLLRVDPKIGAIVGTIWTGAPLGYVQSWLEVDQDGDYIVCDGYSGQNESYLYKIKRDGSAATTLYKGTPGTYFFAFTESKTNGDWLIGDFQSSNKAVIHVNRDTGVVTTVVPTGASVTGMVQDPNRPDIIMSAGSTTFMSYEPVTHVISTVVTGAGSANAMTLDRAPDPAGALLYAGMTSGDIVKFDRNGKNLGRVGNTGAGSILGVCFDRSRNISPLLMTAPNDRDVRLNFPGEAGKGYIFALSLFGFTPGVPLPDGRVIPLNPDSLTFLTVRLPIPPLLTGNIGVLDPFDSATVKLNLNALGNVVKGLRVWAAAIVIDPNAPSGISQISGPMLFVL